MTMTSREGDPTTADVPDQAALTDLQRLLSQADAAGICLVTADGQRALVPEPALRVLRSAVAHLARGRAVQLVPMETMLRTQQAADLLQVSRPYLVKLLESGAIPFTRTGDQRRVALADVLAYRDRRAQERRQILEQMVRDAEELGLYEIEEFDMPVDKE